MQENKEKQAILITRNNAWLVPRTCEIAKALSAHGVKIALIAYTGVSPAFVEPKKTPQLSPARKWIDQYFEEKFIPWLEQRVEEQFPDMLSYSEHLKISTYLTLDQLAQKHGLPGALKIEKMGNEGRAQYHAAVSSLPNLEHTLGISVDTRLIIDDATLKLVPHDGFHPGRMKTLVGQVKALGDATTIKMVKGGEVRIQGAAHRLGSGIDTGGIIGQFSMPIIISGGETMFQIRDEMYRGLVRGYIKDVLPRLLNPDAKVEVTPQKHAQEYPELDEAALSSFLPGYDSQSKVPHQKLIRTQEFLAALSQLLPRDISITDIPEPMSIGINRAELQEFVRQKQPFSAASTHPLIRRYDEFDGVGIA